MYLLFHNLPEITAWLHSIMAMHPDAYSALAIYIMLHLAFYSSKSKHETYGSLKARQSVHWRVSGVREPRDLVSAPRVYKTSPVSCTSLPSAYLPGDLRRRPLSTITDEQLFTAIQARMHTTPYTTPIHNSFPSSPVDYAKFRRLVLLYANTRTLRYLTYLHRDNIPTHLSSHSPVFAIGLAILNPRVFLYRVLQTVIDRRQSFKALVKVCEAGKEGDILFETGFLEAQMKMRLFLVIFGSCGVDGLDTVVEECARTTYENTVLRHNTFLRPEFTCSHIAVYLRYGTLREGKQEWNKRFTCQLRRHSLRDLWVQDVGCATTKRSPLPLLRLTSVKCSTLDNNSSDYFIAKLYGARGVKKSDQYLYGLPNVLITVANRLSHRLWIQLAQVAGSEWTKWRCYGNNSVVRSKYVGRLTVDKTINLGSASIRYCLFLSTKNNFGKLSLLRSQGTSRFSRTQYENAGLHGDELGCNGGMFEVKVIYHSSLNTCWIFLKSSRTGSTSGQLTLGYSSKSLLLLASAPTIEIAGLCRIRRVSPKNALEVNIRLKNLIFRIPLLQGEILMATRDGAKWFIKYGGTPGPKLIWQPIAEPLRLTISLWIAVMKELEV
ncbi:uncharacterized protein BDR25DRAFT_359556 [Lindgomyces ingoldianus]|uniref:Uncharacterized protein n=1 Tax=Lindgomyces ingoldianus TaxID=673940 RepID=A0ACB6QHZ7_9PLEO|nr:uncharacterized protein BDR25DRAFT_359556 [Lindgomyces ingoldianus]KAF2466649.1 hypothetical protein BDR25DRAFT_359556 [Lindgomyces ingoldianus]